MADKLRQRKNPARDLETCIASHGALADVALAILGDDSLDTMNRAPVVAAARYGFEDLDLIQDEVPNYGLIDDLFVLAHGVSEFLRLAGDRGRAYADRPVGGQSLSNFLHGMRNQFYGFWEYCRQNTAGFFEEVQETLREDPSFLPESREAYRAEVGSLRTKTGATHLEDSHVTQFLAQFRAFNPNDVDG